MAAEYKDPNHVKKINNQDKLGYPTPLLKTFQWFLIPLKTKVQVLPMIYKFTVRLPMPLTSSPSILPWLTGSPQATLALCWKPTKQAHALGSLHAFTLVPGMLLSQIAMGLTSSSQVFAQRKLSQLSLPLPPP